MNADLWTSKEWSTGEPCDVARHLNEFGASDDVVLWALFNALNRIGRLEQLVGEMRARLEQVPRIDGGP